MHPLLIIPTRNRPDLAVEALASARRSSAAFTLVVSDNSDPERVDPVLGRACEAARAAHVRPQEVLSMPDHWEWALARGLALEHRTTHVTFLTDRMLLKRAALDRVLALARDRPSSLMSWSHHKIDDARRPVVLHQEEGTGEAFVLESQRLIELASQAVLPQCLPRMMNALVPVAVLDRVRARFGRVFGSISPDYLFAFRALDVCDHVLFLDEPLMAHRAQLRSNGESYLRGRGSAAERDFAQRLHEHGVGMNHATPVPEVRSIVNAMLNEYCVVREETGRFPALDMDAYLAALRADVEAIESAVVREQMIRRLEELGAPRAACATAGARSARDRLRPRVQAFSARPRVGRAFRGLQRLGLRPTPGPWTRFGSVAEAMDFLEHAPRRPPPWPYHLLDVLGDGGAEDVSGARRSAPTAAHRRS